MPIKNATIPNWNEIVLKYDNYGYEAPKKSDGVLVCINDTWYVASEVTIEQTCGALPKVNIHGNLKTATAPRPTIKDVIFNPPATIVFWSDNTKTVVKADDEFYDPEKGLAMAISRKMIGYNKREYYNTFKHYLKKWDKQTKQDKFRKYMEEALDNAFEKYHDDQYNEIHKDVSTVSDWIDGLDF